MVSTSPPTSYSSSPFFQSFGVYNKRTNYNWYHGRFHVPQVLFAFFQFCSVVCGKVANSASSFFFWMGVTITRSGRLAEIRWSIWISKSQRSLCALFSLTDSRLIIYHLFIWSNLNFLHISQWITLPTLSCPVLFSFCDNLLHSLVIWLIVASYLLLLWYNWSLWRCILLLSEEIQFLS